MVEKDPFLPDSQAYTPESKNPESYAQEKFDHLMQLDHYGVRFVNRGEYKALFAEGKIGNEAFWVGGPRMGMFDKKMDKNPIPFARYARFGEGNFREWARIATNQADWGEAQESGDIIEYDRICIKIMLARMKAKKSESQEKRKEIYQNIYNNLRGYVDAILKRIVGLRQDVDMYTDKLRSHYGDDKADKIIEYININFDKISSPQIELNMKEEFGQLPKDKDRYGPDIIEALCYCKQWLSGITQEDEQVLSDFTTNPDYFSVTRNLRNVVNILAYSPFNQRAHYRGGPDPEHRSYHIAVILDDSIFSDSNDILDPLCQIFLWITVFIFVLHHVPNKSDHVSAKAHQSL